MKETGSCKAQRETGCTARTGSQPVSRLKGIGEKTEKLFEKVGVCSLEDLLHYYPRDYDRFEQPQPIGALKEDQIGAVDGYLTAGASGRYVNGLPIVTAGISDMTGKLRLVWYHMPYLKNTLKPGSHYIFRGKVVRKKNGLTMEQPQMFSPEAYLGMQSRMQPVYGQTKGLGNKTITSAVEQALARCSVSGAKLWFNCNPENPMHWFRQEWILQPDKHKALHIHFLMDDNPSLDNETKERYRSMYSGLFYERFILGRWVMSEGLIYDMFDPTENVYRGRIVGMKERSMRYIACDYGTTNPCRFLEIFDDGEHVYVDREYDWDSRKERRQKTDSEYGDDFMAFAGDEPVTVLVDPSAASFIAELRSRGVYVLEAKNDVLDGIRNVAVLLKKRELLINERCTRLLDEMGTYMWDDKASMRGEERPIKQNDHSEDALRYFVNHLPEWRFESVQTA